METMASIFFLILGVTAIIAVVVWTLRKEPEQIEVPLTREQEYIAALKRIYDRRNE
jgi:hypothetical protein